MLETKKNKGMHEGVNPGDPLEAGGALHDGTVAQRRPGSVTPATRARATGGFTQTEPAQRRPGREPPATPPSAAR